MGEALRAAGRPIVYGLCQYGRARVWEWGPSVGGNLWAHDDGDLLPLGLHGRHRFSQSDLGRAGSRVAADGDAEVWAKLLTGEAVAVGLLNRGAQPRDVGVTWAQLKLADERQVRDLWAHADRRRLRDVTVPPHGVAMIRVGP